MTTVGGFASTGSTSREKAKKRERTESGISPSLFLSLCLPLCPPLSLSPLPFPPLCSSEGLFFFPPSLLLPLHRSLSFSLSHPLRRCWNFFVFPSPSPYSVTGWVKPGVTHYNALKHTAARCSTLQHTAMHCDALQCCSVLQCIACVAVCCSYSMTRLTRHSNSAWAIY